MLFGHQKQWQILKKSAEAEKLSHAFLFYGYGKIGKKAFTLEFIKYLNCQANSSSKPCLVCKNCQAIEKGNYPEFILIEPEPENSEIKISKIRDLIWKLSLKTYSDSYKTALIDKAHAMNQESQNCLLKLLEEPRGKTIIFLITEYPEVLLRTILSRVQKIRFLPFAKDEIASFLISKDISRAEAEKIALMSFGRIGLALDFAKDKEFFLNYNKKISDLLFLAKSDLSLRFKYAKNTEEENVADILKIWQEYLRGAFLEKLSAKSSQGNKADVFLNYPLTKLTKIISKLQSTISLISTTNINNKLALEMLLMEI